MVGLYYMLTHKYSVKVGIMWDRYGRILNMSDAVSASEVELPSSRCWQLSGISCRSKEQWNGRKAQHELMHI
jgi:hypothetical protein